MPSHHLRQRLLSLLQPEGHLHIAVHVHRGGELLAALLLPARPAVQRAEALAAFVGGLEALF